MSSEKQDAAYWFERAREAQAAAEQLTTPEARRILLEVAAGYQRMAQFTEERTGRPPLVFVTRK